MAYVDARFNKDINKVQVVERSTTGERVFREYPANYQFFIEDPNGSYKSIYGKNLKRISADTYKDFKILLAEHSGKQLYESDFKTVNVCLSEHYLNAESPKLNVAFFDLETGFQQYAYPDHHMVELVDRNISVFDLARLENKQDVMVYDDETGDWVPVENCKYLQIGHGFSSPEEAINPITSISVHLQWLDFTVCLAIPPITLSMTEATEMIKDIPNVLLFQTEKEMLKYFLEIIEDADVLSGYNSTGFDIPYTVNRIKQKVGKSAIKKLCLWDQSPSPREFEKYGKKATTYDLSGRIHLDYLELYIKYNYEERSSYTLDYISRYELGESKTEYSGTLQDLYNNDFRKFIEYNIQDTELLNKLDNKLKFIDLANAIAHTGTVLIPATMGAVALSEQAIINEAHLLGVRLPERKRNDTDDEYQTVHEAIYRKKAAGAYVAYPKIGLHEDIGALDVKSLYPSKIRAMNMSTETIIGQVRQTYTDNYILGKMNNGVKFPEAWEGIFGALEYEMIMAKTDDIVIIDWENGKSEKMTAMDAYQLIFESGHNIVLSANGTIFTLDKQGIIPGLLSKWYSQRIEYQANLEKINLLETGIEVPSDMLEKLTGLL